MGGTCNKHGAQAGSSSHAVLDRSETRTVDSNLSGVKSAVVLCRVVTCTQRLCDGPIPLQRNHTKMSIRPHNFRSY